MNLKSKTQTKPFALNGKCQPETQHETFPEIYTRNQNPKSKP
jgi:hypothetical protein